jgi:hypothetical protein
MANRPYCIDLYEGDDVIDLPGQPLAGFVQVKAQGIAFLDHKASQGTNERDSRCANRRRYWMDGNPISVTDVDGSVLSLPPRFGFYHFNGTGAATAEAENFKAAVIAAGYEAGDDLTLDWEDIGASGFQQPASWADDFSKFIEDWCGFAIKIYGGDAPRQQLAIASSAILDNFTARRPWFCQYGVFQPSLVPEPWTSIGPFEWQDDGDQWGPGPHTIPGIERYCDNSTVVGAMTVAKLASGWPSADDRRR